MKKVKYWFIRNWMKLFRKDEIWRLTFCTDGIFSEGDVVYLENGCANLCLGKGYYKLLKYQKIKNG